MKHRHLVAFLTLSAWTVFAVWVGAESFDVGECLSIAFIVSGLWIAFAALGSASKEREGRCALFCMPALFLLAWLAYSPPRDCGEIVRRPGEGREAFTLRLTKAVDLAACR